MAAAAQFAASAASPAVGNGLAAFEAMRDGREVGKSGETVANWKPPTCSATGAAANIIVHVEHAFEVKGWSVEAAG